MLEKNGRRRLPSFLFLIKYNQNIFCALGVLVLGKAKAGLFEKTTSLLITVPADGSGSVRFGFQLVFFAPRMVKGGLPVPNPKAPAPKKSGIRILFPICYSMEKHIAGTAGTAGGNPKL